MPTATRPAPSIRFIAALCVVLPVVVVSGVLVALLSVTARRTGEALGASMLEHAATAVAGDVGRYLDEAMRVSDLYALRLRNGSLDAGDLAAWEGPLFEDMASTPDIGSICFGAADGRAVYLQRANGRLEFGLGAGPGPQQCVEYEVTPEGVRLPEPLRVYQYDPRQRPWYRAAASTSAATWTPIYFWFATQRGDAESGTGYARPIRMTDESAAGVLTVDLTLSALSDFLRRVSVGEGAQLFLVDEEGRLIAATEGPVNGPGGDRLMLRDSVSASARAAAVLAPPLGGDQAPPGGSTAPSGHAVGRVGVGGQLAQAVVSPLSPMPGLRWRLVSVVPEAAYMGDARAALNRSLLVALIAVIGASVLALRLAGRLVHPIMAIRAHMKRLGRGEFDSSLDLRAARELQDLSRDLNAAAVDLKNHVEIRHSLELAMQVQQSLLPGRPPEIAGLDLAGKSTYCDQTGGDYFDFIEVIDVPLAPGPEGTAAAPARRGTLVVVGDVMGHGIAAALLMATARSALRLLARQPANLGTVLTDLNNALAGDFRNGRFMTMALLRLDPATRLAAWASAGHEPPIVYEPGPDAFRVLDGGDLPLGIVPGTGYREYELTDLEPGSVLAIGTDGIWEARGGDGKDFGHARLREIIRASAGAPAASIAREIDRVLAAHLGPVRPADDVTYAIAKFTR